MTTDDRSPVVDIYDALRGLSARWSVEVGKPSGSGWIAGTEFRVASTGPFNELLLRIGERLRTADQRITRRSLRGRIVTSCCDRSGAPS